MREFMGEFPWRGVLIGWTIGWAPLLTLGFLLGSPEWWGVLTTVGALAGIWFGGTYELNRRARD